MNPYEFESTLDCRDAGGGPCPGTLPMTGRHTASGAPLHSQTLQHQNQQNIQAAAAAAAAAASAAAAAAAQQSSHYDYEYQHLPNRQLDNAANATAQRTHGRQGE